MVAIVVVVVDDERLSALVRTTPAIGDRAEGRSAIGCREGEVVVDEVAGLIEDVGAN